MFVAGKILRKICLKATRDTLFFHYVACDQGRDKRIQQMGKVQTFGFAAFPSLSGTSLSLKP